MVKIGILTFHRAVNYGAVLQAYALKNFLETMDDEVDIVDYRNKYMEYLYRSFKVKVKSRYNNWSIKNGIRRVMEYPYISILQRKFNNFLMKYLELDDDRIINSNNIDNVKNRYDFFVTGSDQVWNLELTDGDMRYYLDFVDSKKRVSYAASIGGYTLEKECISELKKFNYISVRERETKEKLEKFGIKNIYCHLDPVFLLDKHTWKKISVSPKVRKKYVLLFTMGKDQTLCKMAKDYACENNMDIYYLSNSIIRNYRFGIKQILFASPNEFVGWIDNAEYVFTDSFHGTAFSTLLEKSFFCYLTGKASDNRMMNLLDEFGLNDCSKKEMIGKIDKVNISEKTIDNRKNVKKYFDLILG